jgi:hypothetical protein
MKPPRSLKAGDVVTLGIEKVGEQRPKAVPGKPICGRPARCKWFLKKIGT